MADDKTTRRDTKAYGGLLLGSALLSLFAAAHHPTAGTHKATEVLHALAVQRGPIEAVHGILLGLFALQLVGFYGFARMLGVRRPLPAGGLILMALGGGAMMVAGAINGFALPAFAATYPNPGPADVQAAIAGLRLSWALNQAMASVGAVAMAGAMLLWSIALATRTGWARLVGGAGVAAALVIIGGLVSGLFHLDVSGFILFMTLLSVWTGAVAMLILAGRLQPGG
jgi:hypothetical protein